MNHPSSVKNNKFTYINICIVTYLGLSSTASVAYFPLLPISQYWTARGQENDRLHIVQYVDIVRYPRDDREIKNCRCKVDKSHSDNEKILNDRRRELKKLCNSYHVYA